MKEEMDKGFEWFSGNVMIGNEGIKVISQSLLSNSTLTKLDLSNDRIGDEGTKSFCESLMINTSLTEIDLSCNEKNKYCVMKVSFLFLFEPANAIGMQGAVMIGSLLRTNTTLNKLNLGCERNNK